MSHRTVRWGEKRRRVFMPLVGALLLLAGASGVYANFDRSRWMRSYPYTAVAMFAKGGDRDALLELHRRYKNVELSDSATRSLVEEALDMQRTDPAPANLADWLALLDNFHTGRSFTTAQRERYEEQVFHNLKLEPRTVYREGERLMASLELELRCGGQLPIAFVSKMSATGELVRTSYDKSTRFAQVPSISGSDRQTLKFPALTDGIGVSHVRYEVKLVVLQFEKTIQIDAPIEISRVGESEVLHQVHDASTKYALIETLQVKEAYVSHGWGSENKTELHWEVESVQPLVASLAADVVVRYNHVEFQAGTLMAWRNTKIIDAKFELDKLSQLPSGEVALVLKHNPSMLRSSAGMEQVFVGELELGPLRIHWPGSLEPQMQGDGEMQAFPPMPAEIIESKPRTNMNAEGE